MKYQDIKKHISMWLFPAVIIALLCLVSPGKADAALANYITSIEYKEFTLADGTGTASANLTKGQTIANCVPFVTMYFTPGTNPDNYDRKNSDIYFEAGPKVTATRDHTAGAVNLGIYVVEFNPSYVTVQQGTYSFATTSTTASITAVDQSKAALVFYHKHVGGNDKFHEGSVAGWFSANNELSWQRDAAYGTISGHYYVFEAQNSEFSVQARNFSIPADSASNTTSITSVAMDKTFLIASYRLAYTSENANKGQVSVYLSATDTITAERGIAHSTAVTDIRVFAVTFGGSETVQRGEFAYAAADAQKQANLSPSVDTTAAIAWNPTIAVCPGGIKTTSSTTNHDAYQRVKIINSGAQVQGDHTNVAAASGRWEVIEFKDGGSILLVTPDASNLTAQDAAKKALIESWGYAVVPISANDTQANFDAAVSTSAAAYISEEITSSDLGTKLRYATIGVVNDEDALNDEFGISSTFANYSSASIDITDNTHYITAPFSVGSLTIATSAQALHTVSGTIAGGAQVLAEEPATTNGTLVVIDTGGALFDSGSAAGRRVYLPWGGSGFDINSLNSNGQLLMRKAIEWATVTTNYRSIGTNTGTLFNSGTASISSGSTTVTFTANLPDRTAEGAVGQGDKLVLDGETFFILSRDSATQVTVQNAATGNRSGTPTITRAYNTLQAWEDDCGATPCLPTSSGGRGGDLVADNRIEVGVAYNDVSSGAFVEEGTLDYVVFIKDSTVDATRYRHLTVAEGQHHNGTEGTGAVIDGQSTTDFPVRIKESYVKFEWFEIKNGYDPDNGGSAGVYVEGASNTNMLIEHLLVYDYGGSNNRGVRSDGSGGPSFTVRNSIFYNGGRGVGSMAAGDSVTVQNCTVYNMVNSGYDSQGGTLSVTNSIAMQTTGVGKDDFAGTISGDHNMDEDGTAPGSNSVTGVVANQFISITAGSEDLHLKAGADAFNAGDDLSGTFTDDIDGDSRPLGAGWEIGADETIDGLIAHWNFDEGTDTTAADSVGTNDGTLAGPNNGLPAWTCVVDGYALTFDGDDDEVLLPNEIIGDRAAWTITAWIKMGADTADQRTIYSEGYSAASEYLFLYVDDTGNYTKFYSYDADPPYDYALIDPGAGGTDAEDDAWHLVTMVQRSKTDRELFVGTVSQGTDTRNAGTLDNDMASIGLLRADTWDVDGFLGTIDDVRIYDRALSPAEISALAASPPAAGCGGNFAPTLTVDEPDGTADTVTVGDSYNIQYDLADSDDVVTVAFYYDTDNTGKNGTAITGACATAAEGTNATCSWDTTGMTPGSYYVYGVTNDGTNPDVTDYSPGQITINAANSPPTAPTTAYSNNATAQSGQTNPSGLTDPTPAFSAIYNDPDSGDIANKYRVEVNTNNTFSGTVMWDSGASGTTMTNTTKGNRSPDIIYAGSALASSTTYYWRITFWDDDDTEGAVSATQQFTTSSLSTSTEQWGENSNSDHTSSTEDTYLDQGQTDYNMGAETLIRVGDDGSRINRTLIAFDFSNIDITSSSQIVSATLYVRTNDAPDPGDVAVDLFEIKKDWYEGDNVYSVADEADDEVTWSHQIYSETLWATAGCDGSADRETSSIGVQNFTTDETWYSWDVTASARSMYDNNQYYGWILKAQSEGTTKYWRIFSSEAANASKRPYLEITYNSATPVYYSVGTDTAALYSGNASASSGTLTLEGGPAADKIGVGDEIREGSNRYYITGRNSSTEFTIQDSAATGTPGDTNITFTTTSITINRAFNSLNNAALNSDDTSHLNTSDLVAGNYQLNWACYNDTNPDTTIVKIEEPWVTGVSNYIRVYTPTDTSEVGTSQRHNGTAGTGYRIAPSTGSPAAWYNIFFVSTDNGYVRIEGIEIDGSNVTNGEWIRGISVDDSTPNTQEDIRISHNLIYDITNSDGTGDESDVHGILLTDTSSTKVFNNIIFNITNECTIAASNPHGIESREDLRSSKTHYVYNNTVYNIKNTGSSGYAKGISDLAGKYDSCQE